MSDDSMYEVPLSRLKELTDGPRRAEREMVRRIVEFLRAGTIYNPASGRDRAINGWKSAADAIEREFPVSAPGARHGDRAVESDA